MCLVSGCALREDYVAALVRLHALLKPGGKIVLYTPGRGACAVNIFQLPTVFGLKGVIEATYMCIGQATN